MRETQRAVEKMRREEIFVEKVCTRTTRGRCTYTRKPRTKHKKTEEEEDREKRNEAAETQLYADEKEEDNTNTQRE